MKFSKNLVKSYLKIFFTLVSTTGLLYQTSILLRDFFNGRTAVSITVGVIQVNSLPAATICTDKFFPMEKARSFKIQNEELWQEYQLLVKNLSKLSKKSPKDLKSEIVSKIDKIYLKIKSKIEINSMSVYDLLRNIKINQDQIQYKIFDVIIKGRVFTDGSVFELDERSGNNEFLGSTPIESIAVEKTAEKCFTLFSNLNPIWRDLKFNLDEIKVYINRQVNWIPMDYLEEIALSLHSPNTLPNRNDELRIHFCKPIENL